MNPIETSHVYIFYKFATIVYTMIWKKITAVFFSFYHHLLFRVNGLILFSFIYVCVCKENNNFIALMKGLLSNG